VGLGIRALASGYVRKNEDLPHGLMLTRITLCTWGRSSSVWDYALAARSWIIPIAFFDVPRDLLTGNFEARKPSLRERFPEFAEYERRVPACYAHRSIVLGIPSCTRTFSANCISSIANTTP